MAAKLKKYNATGVPVEYSQGFFRKELLAIQAAIPNQDAPLDWTSLPTGTGTWDAGVGAIMTFARALVLSLGLTVSAGGITVTAGGLTVNAGTTAVQALTATTVTATSAIRNTAFAGGWAMGSLAGVQRIQYDGATTTFNFDTAANAYAHVGVATVVAHSAALSAASQAVLAHDGTSTATLYAYGVNVATMGTLVLTVRSSDGSLGNNVAVLTSALATFNAAITSSGTISSTIAAGNNAFQMASGARFYIDGGVDSFLRENPADTFDFVTGGNSKLTVGTTVALTSNATGGLTVAAGGITVSAGTTAVQALTATTGAFSSTLTVTSASASALAVGVAGASNPALQVDASTASSATGIKVTSKAAAAGAAIAVISSGANENLTIDAKGSGTITFNATGTGNLLTPRAILSSGATAGIGYTSGAGGTVTQLTSKATAVTLNTICGEIVMNGAALAAATIVTFVFNNSAIAVGDQIVCTHVTTGTFGGYTINARPTGAGAASVAVRNNTAGSLSEAIVIRFTVIKCVTA